MNGFGLRVLDDTTSYFDNKESICRHSKADKRPLSETRNKSGFVHKIDCGVYSMTNLLLPGPGRNDT